jgi:hypothetical protein
MATLENRIAALEVPDPTSMNMTDQVIHFIGEGRRLVSVMFLSTKQTIERHDDEDEAVFLARVQLEKTTQGQS